MGGDVEFSGTLLSMRASDRSRGRAAREPHDLAMSPWLTTAASRPATKTAPVEVERPDVDRDLERDVPWLVIVWNDPINLMSYVTWVLQKLFGYPRAKAEKLMMDVHTKGKAVVSSGAQAKAESDVARLHAHGLWATMQKDL